MSDSSDLHPAARVDLAHEPAFELGEVEVRPALRQLVRRSDGAEEVVEPRIMQVLVALARADGGIVTRDELIERCWEGRIVGEDALNRAISRVRRLTDGIGRGSFRLETVTKVGYRLVALGDSARRKEALPPSSPTHGERRVSRRVWIAGAIALAGSGAGGVFLVDRWRTPEPAAPPPEVEALMVQAVQALNQQTREGQNQAFGLFRRVVALRPDYADGWGQLACAYASIAPNRSSAEAGGLRLRAREAAQRALALDPGNARGQAALGLLEPMLGGWLMRERRLRSALARRPDDPPLMFALAFTMSGVGRWRDALALHDRMAVTDPTPLPGGYFSRIMALWGANRLEDADRLIAEAVQLFPTHFAIWFARFYILMYSGRAGEAIALAENGEQRPMGIETAQFDHIIRVARAMESRDVRAVDAAVAEGREWTRRGAGFAENQMQFASALGRVDDAFAIADAYYFSRGFDVPEVRYTREQGSYTPLRERMTHPLFTPSTAAMRADPRFDRLVDEVGLTEYWRASGNAPDYRRSG